VSGGRQLLIALLLGSGSLARGEALENPCAEVKLTTKIIPVRFRPVGDAVQLVDGLLGPCGEYRAPKSVRAITVIDEAQNVSRILTAISDWDVPPPTVELTVSLIRATKQPPTQSLTLADEIRGITKTLGDLTQWTRFEKLDTATIKVSEGSTGQIEVAGYSVQLHVAAVDVNHAMIKVDPVILSKLPEPAEAGSATPLPSTLLQWVMNLREGVNELVAISGQQKDRGLVIAVRAWTDIAGGPSLDERRRAEEK
jgi:hypothetical protein